jgi:membrane protease YdiL (CAAX protease family)
MARWAAFVGLTGVVVLSILALARLSEGLLRAEESAPAGRLDTGMDHSATGAEGTVGDDRLPVFESRSRHENRPSGHSRAAGDLSSGALLANVALTQGLFGGTVAGAAVYFGVPGRALGLGADAIGVDALGVGVAVGVVLWIATEAVGSVADAAGVGYDETLRGLLAPGSLGGWTLLLGGILPAVAVVEELVFRGAAIGAVVAGFGTPAWAIVAVSSLAFGAAHGAQGRVGMALATALGLALAAAFVATDSLLVVIVAHYVVNAAEFVVHEGLDVDPFG